MKTIADILREKGSLVHTIGRDETVYVALQKMAEANIGALLVTDEQQQVVGIVSERDYARKVALQGISSLETPVSSIMTDQVCCTRPDHSVEECLALITEQRCRHLPVMADDKLLGLVSIGDLVKASLAEKEFMISQLTHYIKSG